MSKEEIIEQLTIENQQLKEEIKQLKDQIFQQFSTINDLVDENWKLKKELSKNSRNVPDVVPYDPFEDGFQLFNGGESSQTQGQSIPQSADLGFQSFSNQPDQDSASLNQQDSIQNPINQQSIEFYNN